LIELEMP